MKNLLTATAFAAILIAGNVQIASAAPMDFAAVLAGSNEFPANASPGTGVAYVVIDPALNTLAVSITFSGLEGTTTASHIHCCLASPDLRGVNVMVATTTPTFTGFPSGVTSGSYSHTFDMMSAGSYNPLFITSAFDPAGTAAGAEAALFAAIENDETYLNIHTTMFPGGEIRGYLVPAPEPVTWTLFGAGLIGAVAMRRRKVKV